LKRYQRLILGSAIPWIWIGAAHAGSSDFPIQQVATQRAAQMLPFELAVRTAPPNSLTPEQWLTLWLPNRVELRKGAGFAMTRPIRVGRSDLQLGVAGPVLRKKNLGLALEVRF
jgi:hypothetical protein